MSFNGLRDIPDEYKLGFNGTNGWAIFDGFSYIRKPTVFCVYKEENPDLFTDSYYTGNAFKDIDEDWINVTTGDKAGELVTTKALCEYSLSTNGGILNTIDVSFKGIVKLKGVLTYINGDGTVNSEFIFYPYPEAIKENHLMLLTNVNSYNLLSQVADELSFYGDTVGMRCSFTLNNVSNELINTMPINEYLPSKMS